MKLFGNAQSNTAVRGLMLFAGTSTQGSTMIYDDDGNSINYDKEFAWTKVDYIQLTPSSLTLTIHPIEGSFNDMPEAVSYEITVMFSYPPTSINVNGIPIPYIANTPRDQLGWYYIGTTQSVVINVPTLMSRFNRTIFHLTLSRPIDSMLLSGITQKMARAQIVKVLLDQQWGRTNGIWQEDYESLVKSSTTGSSIGDVPDIAVNAISGFDKLYKQAIHQVEALSLDAAVKTLAVAQLTNGVPFTTFFKEEL